jgi:hypothetical protein
MNLAMRISALVAALVLLATLTLFSESLPRSVSPSGQFIVYGGDAKLRGAISAAAERSKANLLNVLRRRDNWKTPVVINLQLPQANLPDVPARALYFSQTGAGLKLQLDLIVAADFSPMAVQRDLLRAILLEMIYRAQPDLPAGTFYVQAPDWLLDGLIAAEPGRDRGQLGAAVAPFVAAKKVISLGEFLRQKPELLDSAARLLYQAYAFALVELIVDQTNGAQRLARYIDNLSRASNDPLADLKAAFPVFQADDADKVWRASVAKLGSARKYDLLTFAETERHLADVFSKKPKRLEDFLDRKLSASEKIELRNLSTDLLLLATSSNPVMRPIVAEYREIAQLLALGKRTGLRKRLARLNATRAKLVARMDQVDDYMNWFEATQPTTKSGAFADYLRSAAKSETNRRRRDAISVYLDSIELQVQD